MIFCNKCGATITDDGTICPSCGAELKNQAGEYTTLANNKEEIIASGTKTKAKVSKGIIILIAIAAVFIIAFLVVNEMGKASLKKELLRDWLDVDGSIIKVLDFSENRVEYRLETGYSWLDTTVGKYDYKVVSKNKIKIKMFGNKYETYTIKINDDKNMITVTPAITSVDPKEYWFNLDYY